MSAASRSMARPLEDVARDRRPGPPRRNVEPVPAANDNDALGSASSSALPPDALAIVEPLPIATNQGGRARRGQWRVRFAPRMPPFVDPLTGWTGGSDPLANLVLRFPDRESAERFCRRQGIRFETRQPPRRPHASSVTRVCEPTPPVCCWPTGPHALCCGDYPIARGRLSGVITDTALQE